MEWSDDQNISMEARLAYDAGIDLIDGYRGDPKVILEALDQFQAAQSRPYAYAGWAYALMAASYIGGGRKYDMDGLREAQGWLHEANKLVTGRPEIQFVQLLIQLSLEQYDAYLETSKELDVAGNEANFHIQFAYLDYCLQTQSLKKAEAQFSKTLLLTQTENQKQKTYIRMTHHFLYAVAMFKVLGDTLKTSSKSQMRHYAKKGDYYFQLMSENAQDDPWFWHNYSLLHYNLGNYWKAAKFNKKALSLMPFGAAQKIQTELKKKLSILYRLA